MARGAKGIKVQGILLGAPDWIGALGREAEQRLARGDSGIMDQFSRDFEKTLISKALARTGGRRIEADEASDTGQGPEAFGGNFGIPEAIGGVIERFYNGQKVWVWHEPESIVGSGASGQQQSGRGTSGTLY